MPENMNLIRILLISVCFASQLFGQNAGEIILKIRQESESNSQITHTVSYLSDVFGPRLMGTPNYYEAALWAKNELEKWGIDNVDLSSFDNGHRGWESLTFKVEMIAPSFGNITAHPLAHTSSTQGPKEGDVLLIESFDEVYEWEGQLNEKILLLEFYYHPAKSVSTPFSQRLSTEVLEKAKNNSDPNNLVVGYHSRRSTAQVFKFREQTKRDRAKFFEFCESQNVLAIIEPSDYPYGILHTDGNRTVPSFSLTNDIKPLASFVISNEHFGRLSRLVNMGHKPRLKVSLESKFYYDPTYNVNVIAEIEGTDSKLKDELVIIGAHLDSWHAGTGATDNAANCGVMMEALRILKATSLAPKRTIRMILWGGHEQIFSGSASYINNRVGNLFTAKPKKEHSKISVYLNLDNGAGKIRGLYLMGNDEVQPIFTEYLEPFQGDNTLTLQNANQTDHELFDYQNIPAFQFIQDPLDYISALHHTNLDLYEYVPKEDQKFNAEYIAYLAYMVAQRDELLPRKKFNSPIPSANGNVMFRIDGYQEAKQVFLVGNFNNWNMFGTPLAKTSDGWQCKIDLANGKYVYKYIIDGSWTADPRTPKEELVKDGKGHAGLTEIEVK